MSADDRAAAYAAMDAAASVISPAAVSLLAEYRGRSLWGCGDMRVWLPSLRLDAPAEIVGRYFDRIAADTTGRCPLCGAVMVLSGDPVTRPTAWHMLPLVLDVPHVMGCPTQFAETDRPYFDPVAFEPDRHA